MDAEIELLETTHRRTAYFRHCRKYRLHGGAQFGRESEFHEVVERVHFTVPIVLSVCVQVVFFHIIGLVLAPEIVGQENGIHVVLGKTYQVCLRVKVLVCVLCPVVTGGNQLHHHHYKSGIRQVVILSDTGFEHCHTCVNKHRVHFLPYLVLHGFRFIEPGKVIVELCA